MFTTYFVVKNISTDKSPYKLITVVGTIYLPAENDKTVMPPLSGKAG